MLLRQYMSPSWLTCKSWVDQAQAATPVQRWQTKLAAIATRISDLAETPLEVPPTTPQPIDPTPTKA